MPEGGGPLPAALGVCLFTRALREVHEVREVRPSGSAGVAAGVGPSRPPLKRPPVMSHD